LEVIEMVSMPLALLIGGAVFLMVRKGGWAALPVIVATIFGLVLGATAVGGELQGWINEVSGSLLAYIAGAAK
jgi:hypothetical protein